MKYVKAALFTILILVISPIALLGLAAAIPVLILYLIYSLVLSLFDSKEEKLLAEKERWKAMG